MPLLPLRTVCHQPAPAPPRPGRAAPGGRAGQTPWPAAAPPPASAAGSGPGPCPGRARYAGAAASAARPTTAPTSSRGVCTGRRSGRPACSTASRWRRGRRGNGPCRGLRIPAHTQRSAAADSAHLRSLWPAPAPAGSRWMFWPCNNGPPWPRRSGGMQPGPCPAQSPPKTPAPAVRTDPDAPQSTAWTPAPWPPPPPG